MLKGGIAPEVMATDPATVERAKNCHAVASAASGREDSDGTIIFWHRGFAISDIMLGSRILSRAESREVGSATTLFDRADE